MAIPDELMPRTKPEKESSKKEDGFDNGKNNNQLSTNQPSTVKPKTSSKWAWTAKHILPIFLFVLLASTISIAAVPSWRNTFNKFIAKYSPRADEASCGVGGIQGEKVGDNGTSCYQPDQEEAECITWANKEFNYNLFDQFGTEISTAAQGQKCGLSNFNRNKRDTEKNGDWLENPNAYKTQSGYSVQNNVAYENDNTSSPSIAVLNFTPDPYPVETEFDGKKVNKKYNVPSVTEVEVKADDEVKSITFSAKMDDFAKNNSRYTLQYVGTSGSTEFTSSAPINLSGKNVRAVLRNYNWQKSFSSYFGSNGLTSDEIAAFCAKNKPSGSKGTYDISTDHDGSTVVEGVDGDYLPQGRYQLIDNKNSQISTGSLFTNTFDYIEYCYDESFKNCYEDRFGHPGVYMSTAFINGKTQSDGTTGWKQLRYYWKTYLEDSSLNVEVINNPPDNRVLVFNNEVPEVGFNINAWGEVFAEIEGNKGYFDGVWGTVDQCLFGNSDTKNNSEFKVTYYDEWRDSRSSSTSYHYLAAKNSNEFFPGEATITFTEKLPKNESSKDITLKYVAPKASLEISDTFYGKADKATEENGNYVLSKDDIVKVTANVYQKTGVADEPLKDYAFGLTLPDFETDKKALAFQPNEEQAAKIKKDQETIDALNQKIKTIENELNTNVTEERRKQLSEEKDKTENDLSTAIKNSFLNSSEPNWFEISKVSPSDFGNSSGWFSDKMASKKIVTGGDEEGLEKYGKATFYIKGQDEGASKIDFISPSGNFANNPFKEWQSDYKDLATTSEKGIKIGKSTGGASINKQSTCISTSDKQREDWEKIANDIGLAKYEPENESWLTKLINKTKNNILSIFGLNKKAYSEDTVLQVCNNEIPSINEEKILFVGNIADLELGLTIANPKSVASEYNKIYISFVQPVGTKLNEDSLEKLINTINGKNGKYVSLSDWNADGRTVKIDITNKINNDKEKSESLIDSLVTEYEINQDIKDTFSFKFELVGEGGSASNNRSLIQPAKAASNKILATSKETKFKTNKVKDAPMVTIEKIARDINNDGAIDENAETLKNPLNIEGKFIEGIPANYDPDYLEKNNYFDVYKDGDKWKEKVFPGDKIFYKISYSNPNELNYVDFSAKVAAQAEEWDFVGDSEADKKEKDEANKKLVWTYDSIVPDYEVTNRYYIKLKSEILKSNKNFGTYVVIGQNKLEYAYVSNPEKIADIWLKNDLWGKVAGTIKAAKIGTEENLPNVLVGIVADGQILPSFKETYKNISDQNSKSIFLKKNMTDENGKYSLEYNRAKDFLNISNFQIAVNYYDPVNKPVKSIRSSALGQKDVLYYETKNFELSEKGVQNQNIDMSMIKYPESSSPLWLQVQTASRIWINISKGTNIIEDAYGLKFDITKPIIINLLPKTKNVNQETSYVKGNSIYLASYVWDASRLNASEDNGNVESHELSELALKQNNILQSTSSNVDSEKYVKLSVPLVDEVKRGDCGKASAWTVVNYFNRGGDLKKQPMDKVTLNGGVDDLQDNWIRSHTVQNWIYNDKVSNVDFQAIRTSLYYGYPVVVYTAFYGMHVFVLTGYTYDNKTNSYIYFANDPQPPSYGVWPPTAGRIGTTRVNGITLTDSSLSRFMQIRTAMYPRDPGAYIYMPKSYAEKHPLRNIVKTASSDYFGYLNPNTNLSLKEGTAGYMSIDINNRIKYGKEYANYDWSDKMPNGAVKYYMDEFNPAFSNEGFDKKVTPAQESYSLSKLLKMIIYGGKGGNTFWFDETKYGITQKTFYESLMKGLDKDGATKKFFEIIKDKDPKDISDLYDALISYNIGQENPTEISSSLDKLYISALSQIRDSALKKVGAEVEATPQPSTKLNSQIFSPYVENVDPDSAEKNWNDLCQNTEDCGRIESFPETEEESDKFDYENVLSMGDYIYFGNKDKITSSGIYIGLYTGDNGEGGKIDNTPTVITVDNNKVVARDLITYLNFESNDNYRIIRGVGKYVIDPMPVTETATINDLDVAFIKNSAFFGDINGNWQYDPGEEPGKSANGTQFSANYSDITYQSEALDPIEMAQSSVVNEISEPMGDDAGQDIQTLNYKTISGEIFSDRVERQEIPGIPGSYIKFNFPGKDKGMITVKVEYDSPDESLNRSDSYSVMNGELSYFAMPSTNYHSTITITADGYSDSLVIDSDNYWKTVLQDLNFNYILEKTYGESTTAEKPLPKIDVTNPANESAQSAGGGETVIVNAENFDQSEKVEVYIGKNKIGEVSTLGENFGLEVKVPDNIMLGTQTVKLLGNTGQEATANIKVTSNKYFNKVTIVIFFIFIIFLAIAIYIYRKSVSSHNIFQNTPAQSKPSAS